MSLTSELCKLLERLIKDKVHFSKTNNIWHKQVFQTYFHIFSSTLIARWPYWYDTSVHLVNKPYFTLLDNNFWNNHNRKVIEQPRNFYIFNVLYITVQRGFFEDALSFKANSSARVVL